MTQIFKKDDPSVVSNYGPISLLSAVGKVLEKVVHKHLFNYISDDEILSALQSGFIPGDSTVNQLVDIYNTFCKSLDEGKEVCAVFCDISKAFDRVWHRGLLFKHESIGVSDSLLLWFKKFQLDRKSLEIIYTSFIRPLLEYSNVVWDKCTQYESKDLAKSKTKLPALSQEPQNKHHYNLSTLKLAGKALLLDDKNQSLSSFTKCKMKWPLNTSHLLHLRLSVVQQDIDYAMNQTFKLFLLNHNNTITLSCPQ